MTIRLIAALVLLGYAVQSASAQQDTARRIRWYATAPTTCSPTTGDVYYNTTSKRMFTCTASNTWSEQTTGISTIVPGIIAGASAYATISSDMNVTNTFPALELRGRQLVDEQPQARISMIARASDGLDYEVFRLESTQEPVGNTAGSTIAFWTRGNGLPLRKFMQSGGGETIIFGHNLHSGGDSNMNGPGSVSIPNNQAYFGINAAGTQNLYLLGIDTANKLNLGVASGAALITGVIITPGTGNTVVATGSVGLGPTVPGIVAGAARYLTLSTPPTNNTYPQIELQAQQATSDMPIGRLAFINRFAGVDYEVGRVQVTMQPGAAAGGIMSFWTAPNGGALASRMQISQDGGLTIGASVAFAYRAITTTRTLDITDYFVSCDATGGAFTVTLPTAVGVPGRVYVVKRINGAANAVTIATTSSQTIDGAATSVLAAQWASLTVMSDNANWLVH